MSRLRILIAALVIAAGPSMAEQFEAGLAANVMQDYATAMRTWLPLAQSGNAPAQYHVGVMYANGQGAPRDDHQAVFWYRKAADQGNASAYYNLGFRYENGRGVPEKDQ